MDLLSSFRDQMEKGTTAGCHLGSQLGSLKLTWWNAEMILGHLVGSSFIKADLGWMNLTLFLQVAHLLSGYPVLGLTHDSGRVSKGEGAVEVLDA